MLDEQFQFIESINENHFPYPIDDKKNYKNFKLFFLTFSGR